jgi:signal transduction histidine kinase
MLDEQNRFISDASHELKTPLTSLKTAFEVHLRNNRRTLKEADTVIEESIGEVNKLQHLSESLLHLAKYQHQPNQSAFEKTSLAQILTTAVHKVKPQSDEKQIKVTMKVAKISIQGLKYELTDLFVLLLDNAIKYSSPTGTITVTGERLDGTVRVAIEDEGMGISERDLPHVFDRFYRADQARSKHQTDGYGLGLAIAKRIVELHQGRISVQSQAGEGSTFTVTLPINPPAPKTASFFS